jgi:hypothetical protein
MGVGLRRERSGNSFRHNTMNFLVLRGMCQLPMKEVIERVQPKVTETMYEVLQA